MDLMVSSNINILSFALLHNDLHNHDDIRITTENRI